MNVFELFGTIAINNEQANKALADTGKQAGGLSKTMEASFGKLQKTAMKIGAAVASVFAIGKIKDFGQQCSEVYASVAAEQAAFSQIMGDYAVMANEKMNVVAESTGMVATRLTPYMTSLTAKFKGLGYGVDEATSLAQEGLMIAADASAFWDKSLDESMSHLNSFINGSYEGGEAIGLFANDTQMAAYALKNGIIKETKAWAQLDEATKQSTRMRYAKEMMASSGATGQAAKEADAYANVQANLNEQIRQFKAMIGEPIMERLILPGMQKISKMMPDITLKVKGAIDRILNFGATWKTSIWPVIQQKAEATLGIKLPNWETFKSDLAKKWESVKTSVSGFLKLEPNAEAPDASSFVAKISEWWTGKGENTYERVKSVLTWALGEFAPPALSVLDTIDEWWTKDGGGLDTILGFLGWTLGDFIVPAIGDIVTTAGGTVAGWAKEFTDGLRLLLNWQLGELGLPTIDDMEAQLREWWEGIQAWIDENLNINLPLEKNPIVDENREENIRKAAEYLGEYAEGWNNGYTVEASVELEDGAEEAVQGDIDGMSLSGDVMLIPDFSRINSALSSGYLGEYATGWSGGYTTDGSSSIPGHAKGLDFVPRDNYLARLHKGEAVLTSAQADAWRSGSMGGADVGRLEAAINNLGVMMQQLVQNSRSGTQIVLDSGVLVGQLAPALDTQLGTISTRKGRRN